MSGLRPFYCPVELRFCVRPYSDIGVRFRPIFAKEFKTVITGHASKENRTSALYNQKLSLDRASAIKDLLVLNGVESSRIQAVGKGFDEPIASNDTQEGQAKNRRIEAELIKIQK